MRNPIPYSYAPPALFGANHAAFSFHDALKRASKVVRVFCPNCGTQNPDTALTCSKCSFNLKGASAPKFKGTMLMNQPPARPVPASPAASGPPRPVTGPQSAVAPPPASKLKGTMVGVGMVSPYYAGAPSPAPQPAGTGGAAGPMGQAGGPAPGYGPTQSGPAYNPPQGPPPGVPQGLSGPTPPAFYGGPPAAGAPFGQPQGGAGAFGAPPPQGAPDPGIQTFGSPNVNPMGSTIADASPPYFGPGGGQGGGFGAPPQDSPYGGPPGQGAMGQGGYAPPPGPAYGHQPPQGFGAHQGGGFGQGAGGFPPAGGGAYGPPQGQYGAPQQGYAGQPAPGQGFGGAPGYDPNAPNPGALVQVGQDAAMQPMGGVAQGTPLAAVPVPAVPAAPGVHGPKGTVQSGVMCLVFAFISFGIYQIIWFIKCCNEISAYIQRPEPSWLKVVGLSIVTCGLYGFIWELTRCGALIQECQLRAGVPNPQNKGWLYIIPYYNVVLMTEELNKAWQGPA